MPGTFKSDASKWKESDLSRLGIFYHNSYTDHFDFMSMLRLGSGQTRRPNLKMPREYNLVVHCTKYIWDFSFEFDLRNHANKAEMITKGKQDAERILKKLQQFHKNYEFQITNEYHRNTLEIFNRWKVYLMDFLKYFRDLLERWDKEMQREERFTQLFMNFSRICLLRPENGHTFKVSLKIADDTVNGFPDARFVASSSQKTVALTEVKIENVFKIGKKGNATSISKKLPPTVLGQHGVELLMENDNSIFESGVAGLICIGTKVIFTFLDITDDHINDIIEHGKTASTRRRATIFYTNHFDFMKVDDRNIMLKLLLKFAAVQSESSTAN